jgi:hypothetical protein
MKRLAIAFTILAAACSGTSKQPSTTTGAGSGSGEAIYGKKYVISFAISQDTSAAEVFLQTTDEIGHQVSHSLGTFAGTCKVIKPVEDMHAVTAVNCAMAGSDKGVELDAVVSASDIVILKLDVQVGVTPDPMARTEIARIKAPAGAAVSPDS